MQTLRTPLGVSEKSDFGRAPYPLAKNRQAKGHKGQREAPGLLGPFWNIGFIRITKARFSVTF